MKIIMMLLLAALALTGCRRTDVREFSISIPELKENNVTKIVNSISVYSGVIKDSIKVDVANRTITLKYDSMQIAKKNIEMSIAEAGFTANGVKPESVGTNID
jgi:copper chaperone CopZ